MSGSAHFAHTPEFEQDTSQETDEQTEDKSPNRKAGRPRSEQARQSITDATNKLLLHMSVRDISIEAIAKKAGVGKTTIYRWWPNKVGIILEAISGPMSVLPAPVSGESAKDLLVSQIERFGRLSRGRGGKVIAEVFAEAQGNPETLNLFYQHFMLHHEEVLANIIEQGKRNGEFRSDLDTSLAVDMIYGGIFYRLMSNTAPLEMPFIDSLVMESLRIFSAVK
jgi:AcrR family transcriptional regulator